MQIIIYWGSKIIIPFIKLYWFIFRPKIYGVGCIVEYSNRILLVRHTYGKRSWGFPGGGIKKGEKPEDAAKREIKEEIGIDLVSVKYIGEFLDTSEYVKDKVYCFYGEAKSEELKTDKTEILEAGWFPIDNLPVLSDKNNKLLEMWRMASKLDIKIINL